MWEWRAFAPGLDEVAALLAEAEVELREDVYLLAEGLPEAWSLKLRGGDRLEAKRRRTRSGELEEWEKLLSHALPVPPWEVRALARELTPVGRVPVRPVRDAQGALDLLPATGLGASRSVRVTKHIRSAPWEGALLEHVHIEHAGGSIDSVALSAGGPEALQRARKLLSLPGDARIISYRAFVEGLK